MFSEKNEDTKAAIINHNLKNVETTQLLKEKRTSNDLENITQEIKDVATRISAKAEDELKRSGII